MGGAGGEQEGNDSSEGLPLRRPVPYVEDRQSREKLFCCQSTPKAIFSIDVLESGREES